jgi:ParB family transcriptional regulator, chromosome partitioning protein
MPRQKSALGRGLGALLPVDDSEAKVSPELARTKLYNFQDRVRAAGRMTEIGIHLIDPNPYQPRSSFEVGALEELARSIKQLGIIQPVTVREFKGGRYQLISGERRWRAAKLCGLTTIPAFIRTADNEAMLEMAIVENVQRTELNPIDIALGYQRLMAECDLTQEKVSEKVGKSRAAVTNMLRLLNLAPEVQAALKKGTVSAGHARPLLSLEGGDQQVIVLARIEREGLSVRAVEKLVRELLDRSIIAENTRKKPEKANSSLRLDDPQLASIRDRIRSAFGTQVIIKPSRSNSGGSIELEYYSDDDLERLVELLLD